MEVTTVDKNKIKLMAFDLDGTLSNHRTPMPEENARTLKALATRYKLIMMGAGDAQRIFKQMNYFPIDVIGNYGLQYGKYNEKTKSLNVVKSLSFPIDREYVQKRADYIREKYGFVDYKGDGVEFHDSGCVVFALLGTKADINDKLSFDPDRSKRRAIYDEVKVLFNDYQVFIGGSSSFDMAPSVYNKKYALDLYCKENGIFPDEVLYFGDDYGTGGNDECVYKSEYNFVKVDDYTRFPKIVNSVLK